MQSKKINQMKYLFLFVGLMLCATFTSAQGPLYKGDTQLNLGLGFSNHGVPVFVGLDHAISRDVTLGGELSYRGYNENWSNTDYHHNIWGISGNANYHFNYVLNLPSEWDFYAGLNVGFVSWNSPKGYGGSYNSGLGLGAQVGGRYYFNKNIGVNLEFGGGNEFSGGKIGLTFIL